MAYPHVPDPLPSLVTSKVVATQQEQEARPSSSQAQQGTAAAPAEADSINFNIRQAERYFTVLQGQITSCETWVPLGPHRPGSRPSMTSGSSLPENTPTCQWARST
jgi:hypothetical protein